MFAFLPARDLTRRTEALPCLKRSWPCLLGLCRPRRPERCRPRRPERCRPRRPERCRPWCPERCRWWGTLRSSCAISCGYWNAATRSTARFFRLRLRPGRRPAIFLVGPERARWVFKQTDDETLSIGASLAFTRRLFGPDFYFLAEPAEYRHQRETLLPLLRARMAAGYLAIMDRHCARLVARLGDSGTFDLPQEMNALVLGIIMEAFLGADFAQHMPPTVARDFRDFIRGLDPITPGWVPAPHLVRARRARDRLRRAVAELVRARRSQPLDPPDFLQELISAHAPDGAPATDRWVVQMALGVTFAGHDSTTGHSVLGRDRPAAAP